MCRVLLYQLAPVSHWDGMKGDSLETTAKGSAGKQEFYHRLLALLRSEVSGLSSIAINHRHIHSLLGFY